jgi:hypothetical protein
LSFAAPAARSIKIPFCQGAVGIKINNYFQLVVLIRLGPPQGAVLSIFDVIRQSVSRHSRPTMGGFV